jgi:hypothetical protein
MKNTRKNSNIEDKTIAGFVAIATYIGVHYVVSLFIASSVYEYLIPIIFMFLAGNVTMRFLRVNPVFDEKAEERRVRLELFAKKQNDFKIQSLSYCENGTFTATYLGGSGNNYHRHNKVIIGQGKECIYIGNVAELEHKNISFKDLSLIEISGEGTVTTNAGVIGGGFGLEGAIEGAIAAGVINKVTSKMSTNTFIRIMTNDSEMYFHTSEREPAQLQMFFSKAFVALNSSKTKGMSHQSISDELVKLHSLFKDGVLTQDEFDSAKKNLLERR